MIKNKRGTKLLVVLFAIAILAGCGSKTVGKNQVEETPDLGQIVNLTYDNQYFGLKMSLPEGWEIQDVETKEMISEKGKEIIAGENQNQKAMLDASLKQTLNLLTIFKFPLGTPETYNPSLVCVAERVKGFPGIKSGQDYLLNAKKIMESAQIHYEYPKDMYSENINNVSFDIMEVEIDFSSFVVKQKYYSTIIKGYALNFVLSYSNQEELEELNEIIKTINFR